MKKLGKLLRNLLIICGVLFIIALLLPDEEEMPADQEQTSIETASGIGTQTGRDKRRWKGPSDRICLYEWFGSGIGGRRGNGGSL